MRWDRLFDDLEAQFEAGEQAAVEAEVADLVRAEWATLTLADRLRAHVGAVLVWQLAGTQVEAELVDLGATWLLLRHRRDELVVPLAAVRSVRGLTRVARPEAGAVARRLTIGVVLRRLARDRVGVRLRLEGGSGAGGDEVSGTIDRVGVDHLDLAEHADGAPRRQADVRQVRTVPLRALVWVTVPG